MDTVEPPANSPLAADTVSQSTHGLDGGEAMPRSGMPSPDGAAAPSVLIYARDSTDTPTLSEHLDAKIESLRRARETAQANKELQKTRGGWSRQQKRIFQRVKSLLLYWEGANYDVLWVVLTTAVGGSNKKLAYHHKMLRNRIERNLKYKGIEFVHVETMEGNGVLHVMWAWKRPEGKNRGVFYIDQSWLSEQWHDIHGAKYVFINRYRNGKASSARVSRYLVTQYVANQDALIRVSWSRMRSLGFPMAKTWTQFKSIWKRNHTPQVPYRQFIEAWERLILVRKCDLGEQQYAIIDEKLTEI